MDTATPKSATEVLDCAVKATQAGYEIDEVQLSEMTGFKIRRKEQAAQPQEVKDEEPPQEEVKQEEIEDKADEEEQPKEEVTNSAPIEEPQSQEEKDTEQKASLLKAFDLVINPIRFLVSKLFSAKSPDEEAQIRQEIEDLTKKIENQEENEYITAIQNISK
jgi:hypothetical protein